MDGLKDLFAHKRTWALVVGLLFQIIAPLLHLTLQDPNVAYIVNSLPFILAGLWTALVLGQAYEDKVTRMATSALTVTMDETKKEGGPWFALLSLIRNEAFVSTLLGTIIAVVTLCVPWWTGLPELQEVFVRVAELIAVISGALTMSLKYSSAHAEPSST